MKVGSEALQIAAQMYDGRRPQADARIAAELGGETFHVKQSEPVKQTAPRAHPEQAAPANRAVSPDRPPAPGSYLDIRI